VDKTRSSLERALGRSTKVGRPAGLIGCRWNSWFLLTANSERFTDDPALRDRDCHRLRGAHGHRHFCVSILFAYLINPMVRFLQHFLSLFRTCRPHVLEALSL
jgi:hypothetical protein